MTQPKQKTPAPPPTPQAGKKPGPAPIEVPQTPPTIAAIYGELVWLMGMSPLHRRMFVADLEWFLVPPIQKNQFRIFRAKERPIGVALWAYLDAERDAAYATAPGRLKPEEWDCGDTLWLVDLIAPFGHAETMLADLKASVFRGKNFKYHRTMPDGSREVVSEDGTDT